MSDPAEHEAEPAVPHAGIAGVREALPTSANGFLELVVSPRLSFAIASIGLIASLYFIIVGNYFALVAPVFVALIFSLVGAVESVVLSKMTAPHQLHAVNRSDDRPVTDEQHDE